MKEKKKMKKRKKKQRKKESEPLTTADKEQELAPKHVKRQPVTRGNDFLWEL